MIQVEALTRTYGDLTAVDQVSFEIGQGEIVGLLGHNGAGKTTIMKMLTGYLEPTSGSIEIDGLDIATHREVVQSYIGYLPENDPLYPEMTVIDYLDYAASLHGVPKGERAERIREAIDSTELSVKATDTIGTLSRGYCQRVGVAQAILHNPRLLILDEPTNGLDPTQVQHMRDLIRALSKRATVILSTHILQEVQAICDRVIIIRNGHKALDATMDELQAGRRLLVAVDAGPEQALDLFKSVDGIQSVESLSAWGPGHRYALALDSQGQLADTAPNVAKRIATAGWKLYALQPERRDLETIFGEISAQEGR
ncbi:ABC transporter related protein [Nitrosococcus halophilus Nc 4]|uniref:ABC transporter related protein n=1 Tax=Nitrosococcus halophilus (strain Nc4) TaxID=472759 RepID=D5BZM5_NITHN|nr:ATP-binding cassette domain-containing protein [Nitrosococcus halophilus]ADE14320.1 ABC transporter related protein [Nitrosococcus halophilus Nc 4]